MVYVGDVAKEGLEKNKVETLESRYLVPHIILVKRVRELHQEPTVSQISKGYFTMDEASVTTKTVKDN